jgi:hypothetical protein
MYVRCNSQLQRLKGRYIFAMLLYVFGMGRYVRENIAASGTIKNAICCSFTIATRDSTGEESCKIIHKCNIAIFYVHHKYLRRGYHGHNRMVVGFTISLCQQCLSPLTLWVRIQLRQGVLYATLCDPVCQWLATGLWFSQGTLVSSTNKTDRHYITEILLEKVLLSTILLTQIS